MKMSKKLRSNLITYGIVIAAFLLCQLALSGSIEGFKMSRFDGIPCFILSFTHSVHYYKNNRTSA